ncbi:MAG TPA: VWA domain-containing protein [Pyrinomonadaceae bacterium]|nr:VWA domain-containing protein [Pyrinomonadaceae bacterium]
MNLQSRFTAYALLTAILLASPATFAQQQPQRKSTPPDDVVRVDTELVQTDVTVLDKWGRLVSGLGPDQFELRLDGQPQPITFFEFVRTGSASEGRKLAASRGLTVKPEQLSIAQPETTRSRVIFFYLDDVHLSSASLIRARKALTEFIENQMNPGDQVAIVSTSGQVGFLQQLTDYKPMLRTAVGRLSYKRNPETYSGKVPISEYDAVQVADNNDRDLFVYLVLATMNEYQSKGALQRVAANIVKNRVRQVSTQSRIVNHDMLEVLESLMRSSASLPGRKLVFFMSDGFVSNLRGSNAMAMLKRVTAVAAQSGVVVYSMDARGSINDAAVDAGRNDFPEGMATGTQARHPNLENAATQEPLRILADDTGGRAILGSNSFADAFRQAIDETSEYYLLAWRPNDEAQRRGRASIKVTVKDRPELRVRLRRNYYIPPRKTELPTSDDHKVAPVAHASPQTAEQGLVTALGTLYPRQSIPTALSVGYLNTAGDGSVLKASMQLDRAALNLAADGPKETQVDVVGAAVDDRGVIVTFKQLLTIPYEKVSQLPVVVWNQQLRVPPGLYQVRVAVRERSTGLTGSARQWIEVPPVSDRRFQLSSLFLAERTRDAGEAATKSLIVDVDQHFSRTSVLRFQTYVYNPPRDVEMQARILRGKENVLALTPGKLPTDTTKDSSRLPYWAEVPLDRLPPGRYSLEVTAIDRNTKHSVSQQSNFIVD